MAKNESHGGDRDVSLRRRTRAVAIAVATYVVAGALGYGLGARGVFSSTTSTSTPLARVGLALREETGAVQGQRRAEDWAALGADVEAVRRGWTSPDRGVLDLVVALRGLASGGNPEWDRAAALC